jgi:serine/threonine-protein kinase
MLIDFNVAQQTSATVTGTIVGKQCYLPPEQFQGDPVIQSDIYAMGATIFFLCTGRDPEPISQSRPAKIEPDISSGFNMFVANCTTIDPDLRYKNADECLVDLRLLTGQTDVR